MQGGCRHIQGRIDATCIFEGDKDAFSRKCICTTTRRSLVLARLLAQYMYLPSYAFRPHVDETHNGWQSPRSASARSNLTQSLGTPSLQPPEVADSAEEL